MAGTLEKWKPYGTYEVSNLGRLRDATTKRILRQRRDPKGHYYATINGSAQLVSRIMGVVWFGLNPDDPRWVRHLRGKSNRLTNLVVVPRYGKDCPAARLTEANALRIVELHRQGVSQPAIAEMMGCSRSNVSAIVTGRNWTKTTGVKRASRSR
jgi:hypothetical protein